MHKPTKIYKKSATEISAEWQDGFRATIKFGRCVQTALAPIAMKQESRNQRLFHLIHFNQDRMYFWIFCPSAIMH